MRGLSWGFGAFGVVRLSVASYAWITWLPTPQLVDNPAKRRGQVFVTPGEGRVSESARLSLERRWPRGRQDGRVEGF